MSYAIMRIQKIKSYQALAEREKHNLRAKTVLSSDNSGNIEVIGSRGIVGHVKALEKKIDMINSRKTRKDAIKTMEILFTSDKKFFKHCDADVYFNECRKWLVSVFGESNLLQSVIHRDEEVEHMHCILTTIKDNKFNYSGYIRGRQELRALQDSFYQQVKHLGLERGRKVELTHASYQSNKEWQQNISKAKSYAEALSASSQLDYAIKGIIAQETEERLKNKLKILSEETEKLKYDNSELEKNFNALKNISNKELKMNDEEKEEYLTKIIRDERRNLEKMIEIEPPTMEELGFEF